MSITFQGLYKVNCSEIPNNLNIILFQNRILYSLYIDFLPKNVDNIAKMKHTCPKYLP